MTGIPTDRALHAGAREGTWTWFSSTGEFGSRPAGGGSEVLLRVSSYEGDDSDVTPPESQGEDAARYRLKERVEVRTRYQVGQWARGYEITGVLDDGYNVGRPGSEPCSEVFASSDIRRASDQ